MTKKFSLVQKKRPSSASSFKVEPIVANAGKKVEGQKRQNSKKPAKKNFQKTESSESEQVIDVEDFDSSEEEESAGEDVHTNGKKVKMSEWMDSDEEEDVDLEGLDDGEDFGEDSSEQDEEDPSFHKLVDDSDSDDSVPDVDDSDEDDEIDMDEFGTTKEDESPLIVNQESEPVMDMKSLRDFIQATIAVLGSGDISKTGKSRADLLQDLHKAMCQYYDYSEYMLERLSHLFKPAEFVEFLEANEVPRPVTIRVNTLKTRRKELAAALIARGVNVEPLDKWTPVGLQVFESGSKVPVGATPEYLAGHYLIQSAASFLPVMALDAREGERVLDMCAAPGGKTTHLAMAMRNTGVLFANDVSEDRLRAVIGNLHRMGVTNSIVTCMDGRKIPTYMSNFDRVLLDAPCSGTGIIAKDASVKQKTTEDFVRLGQDQRELILAAIDATRVGGTIVYSTCAVTVEENEAVVQYALSKRDVKIVESGLPFGTPGFTAFRGAQFDKSLGMTRRYYPHTHNLDGFYVARLVKSK